VPSPGASLALRAGPPPGATALAAGATVTFTWTFATTGAGAASFAARLDAVDGNSGDALVATASAGPVPVQRPASLEAALVSGLPAVMSAGQTAAATVRVSNAGEATALLAPAAPLLGSPLEVLVAPAAPAPLPGGASVDLTWTVRAAAPGADTPRFVVAGTDGNSGAAVAPVVVAAAAVTVQAAAALEVALASAPPAVVSVGQAFQLLVRVANRGQAAAALASAGAGPSGAGLRVIAAPSLPPSLPGGASLDLAWTVEAAASGDHTLAPWIAATDGTSGAEVSAALAPARGVTAQAAAALVAVASATPGPLSVGQPLTVTLTVSNTGAAGASVTPSLVAPAGLTRTAGPAGPSQLPGGAQATFTWTFLADAAGAPTFAPRVDGADANSGAPVSATASAGPVPVQRAAALTAEAVAALPARLSVGQTAPLTVRLANAGEAAVALGEVAVAPSGPALELASAPVVPATLPGGASVELTWTVRAAAAGSAAVGGSFAGSDVNSGVAVTTALAPRGAVVERPAALAASLAAAAPPCVSVGQAFDVTLRVANAGEAAATLTSAAVGLAGAGLEVVTAPALPRALGAGASTDLTWRLRAAAPGEATVAPSVRGQDVNSGAAVSAAVATAAVAVQTPAALAVTLVAPPPATVPVGQAFTLRARVRNAGQAAATLAAVDAGLGGGALTVVDAPAIPAGLAGGAAVEVEWMVRAVAAGPPPWRRPPRGPTRTAAPGWPPRSRRRRRSRSRRRPSRPPRRW
jgi:hypothetical protein